MKGCVSLLCCACAVQSTHSFYSAGPVKVAAQKTYRSQTCSHIAPARQRVRSRRTALPEGADAATISDSNSAPLASNGEGPKYRAFLDAAMEKVDAAMELTECTIPQHLQHNSATAGKQA
eukprot:1595-Heterococcus_DN1.PRE.7